MARVSDLLAAGRTFSFEFFPPQTDGAQLSLGRTIAELEPLAPSFVSVTYGAGGSSRQRTREVVTWVRKETAITPMAHLTCQGHTRAEIAEILDDYRAAGIENILALGGDLPADLVDDHPERLHVRVRPARRRRRRRLLDRRRRPPGGPPAFARPGRPTAATSPPSSPGPTSPSPSSSSRPSTTCGSSTSSPTSASTSRCCPGIMPITNAGQIRRMAQLSGAALPALARRPARRRRRPRRGPPHRRRRGHRRCAPSCSTPARPACTSTR